MKERYRVFSKVINSFESKIANHQLAILVKSCMWAEEKFILILELKHTNDEFDKKVKDLENRLKASECANMWRLSTPRVKWEIQFL